MPQEKQSGRRSAFGEAALQSYSPVRWPNCPWHFKETTLAFNP